MKIYAFAFLIIASNFYGVAIAHESSYPSYSIPTDSPFSLLKIQKTPSFLYFDGEIEIEATFTFNYLVDAEKPYVEFTISPSQESKKVLPYLTERGKEEKPTEIIILDKEIAARILLGEKLALEIFSGKLPTIEGKARIVINKIGAGYECDKAVFVAYLKKVIKIISKVKKAHQEKI